MNPTSTTQKQRERYARLLDNQKISLNKKIFDLEIIIREIESGISQKSGRRKIVFQEISQELNEYSSIFSLGWPNFSLQNLEVGSASELRLLVNEECNLERLFNEKSEQSQKELWDSILRLKERNPGKIRRFERKSIQREIDEMQKTLEEIKSCKYPRSTRLAKLKSLLVKFDGLDINSDEKRIRAVEKELSKLLAERNGLESRQIGDLFESSCIAFVEAERERRRVSARERKRLLEEVEVNRQRDAKRNEDRLRRKAADRKKGKDLAEKRQKERAASLKVRLAKNKSFLANSSETNARKDLQSKMRAVMSLERQCSSAEEACLRKVKQLRTTSKCHLLPQHQEAHALIRELLKQDWPRVPQLDNLVARLKQKTKDLASAKAEVKVAEKLVEKIVRAKEEVEEYKKISHVLSSTNTNGKGKGAPPRISVENWEDAEELAVRYVRWLGFVDARRTKAGSDEGKDVESSKCVVQVKDMGTGATRPMLQQLFGVASAERKFPIFFSRSFAKTALEWGELHGIALFTFNRRGTVTPVNAEAKKLMPA
jgi:hypothetical protein